MPRTLVIFNPAARSEKAANFADRIAALCAGAEFCASADMGEARAFSEKAVREGVAQVVVAGGDGTINEVVNGIAGSSVTLGVLPVGTMNVFATELGLPVSNLEACWEIIMRGDVRSVDLATANDRHFVQLAGVGLDAQALQATTGEFKRQWGPLSYVISAAQIAAKRPPRLRLEAGSISHEGSFVMIGNGRYYGGPFTLFNDARIDDGKLDVLLFRNLGYIDIVRYLQAILLGMHGELPDVEYLQLPEVRVTSEDQVPVEVDGDVIGELPVRFAIGPHRLRVLAPPAA